MISFILLEFPCVLLPYHLEITLSRVSEREREREREREIDRQTDRQSQRESERQREFAG